MVLGFSQKFPKGKTIKGKETNFKPKILADRKIHTMREDVHSRWRVGMSMQLAHGVRTKVYDHFATKELKKIQIVTITYTDSAVPVIKIDGRELGILEMIMLAAYDGFDCFSDFLEWFDVSGEYKLLHWTDHVYDGNLERLDVANEKFKNTIK